MQCAHEGQITASLRGAGRTSVSPRRTQDVTAVIAAILEGQTVLGPEDISTLASHLHNCSVHCVGPSELSATLQAAEVLVRGRQVQAVVGCGLAPWLLESIGEVTALEDRGRDILHRMMELLTQTVSILLVSPVEGSCHVMVPLPKLSPPPTKSPI